MRREIFTEEHDAFRDMDPRRLARLDPHASDLDLVVAASPDLDCPIEPVAPPISGEVHAVGRVTEERVFCESRIVLSG